MINNSKIVLFKTTNNNEGYLGTPRGIIHHLFGINQPDYHEWFDIDEKISDMIQFEMDKGDDLNVLATERLECLNELKTYAMRGVVWNSKQALVDHMLYFAANPDSNIVVDLVDEIYEVLK